jgi:hypothetical protein
MSREKQLQKKREEEDRPSINFNDIRTIKYYDKPQRHLEKKHFQQQANIEAKDTGQRKITDSDFQSSFNYAKEIKSKLSENPSPKSSVPCTDTGDEELLHSH